MKKTQHLAIRQLAKKFDLTQDEIIEAVRAGKLQYKENHIQDVVSNFDSENLGAMNTSTHRSNFECATTGKRSQRLLGKGSHPIMIDKIPSLSV